MKSKNIYIAQQEWFESTAFKNPMSLLEDADRTGFEEYAKIDFDLKLLVTKKPSSTETAMPFYNAYREQYGSDDVTVLSDAAMRSASKNVFLSGFSQEHFEYIVPFIKSTAEVLYLFKCPRIADFSALAGFAKLRAVFVYHNTSATALWDMQHNPHLQVLSLQYTTNLHQVNTLPYSTIEYLSIDGIDNSGKEAPMLFDSSPLYAMPRLKYLNVMFRNYTIKEKK